MKELTAEEKLQMAFADNLIAQTELLDAITKLENIMVKIFNGNETGDPAIEEGDLERDLEREEGDRILTKDEGIERIERHEAGEPDAKELVENDESGLLPDDDEDKDKDN